MMQNNPNCCNDNCNQGRDCPVRAGTHKPDAAEQAAWFAGLDEGRAQAAPAAVAVPDALREAEAALEVAIARILKADPSHSIGVTSEAKALVAVRAALAATPAADAEPFMRAIQGPDGLAYFDEGCVNSSKDELQAEVKGLNSGLEPDDGRYQIVPLFLCATQAQKGQACLNKQH